MSHVFDVQIKPASRRELDSAVMAVSQHRTAPIPSNQDSMPLFVASHVLPTHARDTSLMDNRPSSSAGSSHVDTLVAQAVSRLTPTTTQPPPDVTSDSVIAAFWDYGGQDVFLPLHHLLLSRYGVYVLVFDMSDFEGGDERRKKQSMATIRNWMVSIAIHSVGSDGRTAPVFIIGTHKDKVWARVCVACMCYSCACVCVLLSHFTVIEFGVA